MYKTINDAKVYSSAFAEGETEVWYQKSFARRAEIKPDADNLEATHVFLGKIAATELESIYMMLQGENWSRQGEANELVVSKGCHTSMSEGDIVVIDGVTQVVAAYGFSVV